MMAAQHSLHCAPPYPRAQRILRDATKRPCVQRISPPCNESALRATNGPFVQRMGLSCNESGPVFMTRNRGEGRRREGDPRWPCFRWPPWGSLVPLPSSLGRDQGEGAKVAIKSMATLGGLAEYLAARLPSPLLDRGALPPLSLGEFVRKKRRKSAAVQRRNWQHEKTDAVDNLGSRASNRDAITRRRPDRVPASGIIVPAPEYRAGAGCDNQRFGGGGPS